MMKMMVETKSMNGSKYLLDKWPFEWPVHDASVSDGFGFFQWRKNEGWSGYHYGIDIGGIQNYNKPVLAMGSGIVIYSGLLGGYGNLVAIRHGKNGIWYIETRYAHLKEIWVKSGQTIKKGQPIGLLGGRPIDPGSGRTTSEHLHLEIGLRDSRYPWAQFVQVNPEPLLPKIKEGKTI